MPIKTETYTGQLRHHFWGEEYFASIGINFRDPDRAKHAASYLGDDWNVSENNPNCIVWHGDSDSLDNCVERLVALGAEKEKIASIKYSIDYGEPFEVRCPPYPDKTGNLFEEM